MEDTLQRIGGNHPDCVRLKIMAQLSRRNEDCVEHLPYHGVPCLGVSEYFTDIVHRMLDARPGGDAPTSEPALQGSPGCSASSERTSGRDSGLTMTPGLAAGE